MRKAVLLTLAVALALTGTRNVQAQDECRAIIDKAIKAMGGAEKLSKYQAWQMKTKGKLQVMGLTLDMTQDVSLSLAGKFKEASNLEVMGQKIAVTVVYDGTKGWVNARGETKEMDEKLLKEMSEAVYMFHAVRLTGLADKKFELSALGETKVDDKPAVGVRISSKGHRDINLYFSKESGVLVKLERRAADPMSGQEFNEERMPSGYRDVEGVKMPTKIRVLRDGKEFLDAEVTDIKMLEKLDDSEFAKP